MNELHEFKQAFDLVRPWSGDVPSGYVADFLGVLHDVKNYQALTSPEEFRSFFGFDITAAGGRSVNTKLPKIGNGKNAETWFEAVDWIIAAREADRPSFVMITLGANYGAQAVGAWHTLRAVNPRPCKLVAVDPVPGNVELIKEHFSRNGIDPDAHWIVPYAAAATTAPVLFPVGAPASGVQNCFSTNEAAARERYLREFIESKTTEAALEGLLLRNSTTIRHTISTPLANHVTEIEFVSAISLKELLAPFDRVDYLESDIQQSEILVFPPCMALLRKKVRRIHIGTHGDEVHASLLRIFADAGWEVVFNYEGGRMHQSELGPFMTSDGILTVRNPDNP